MPSDTLDPLVARSGRSCTCKPSRWRAPPSSTGAGMFDQSTSNRSGLFVVGMWPSPLLAHKTRLLALPVALLCRLAPIVQFLALGEGQLKLGKPALVEIELERDHGHALTLDGDAQFVDLLLLQKQTPRPARLVLEERAR